jgi:hypothetical protein
MPPEAISTVLYGLHARRVQDPLNSFFKFTPQFHLLASCGVKILEVSAVAAYNSK